MKKLIKLLILYIFITGYSVVAQTARIKGVLLDESSKPIENATVRANNETVKSNENGFFQIKIPANTKVIVEISHVSYKKSSVTLDLKNNEDYELNVVLNQKAEQLGEVIVSAGGRKRVEGVTTLEPQVIRMIPGANAGVENILKTLPGVYSNNELSTQYAVRGGNYDENLVYVNEIEVYRPFLIRSGQQEGLSFTNTEMVSNVDFSAGGFQAKYGDKLSSVLDITYRRPTKFQAAFDASLLGGSATVDLVSKNQKWSNITGIRYRDNSMLVNSQETETNFKPTFADIQTQINFDASTKWQWC